MSSRETPVSGASELRRRALEKLPGRAGAEALRHGASAALGVLHDLASSPATAADALAVLHELQVHQVELELQAEELARSRAELEQAVQRQTQLYDAAPVGMLTIDERTTLHELNQTGAALLGGGLEDLLGRRLDSLLMPDSAEALRAMMAQTAAGLAAPSRPLRLRVADGMPPVLQAWVTADPAGARFLVGVAELAKRR